MTDKEKDLKSWIIGGLAALLVPVIGNGLLLWRGQSLINRDIAQLAKDIEDVAEHDVTVTKFWRLHSWERARLNELRIIEGMPIAEWPDLTVEGH